MTQPGEDGLGAVRLIKFGKNAFDVCAHRFFADMQMLADSLAMGTGLYMTFELANGPVAGDGFDGRAWLEYLHFLQQEVVRHYFGERMTGFEYVMGYDDVSLTRWTG